MNTYFPGLKRNFYTFLDCIYILLIVNIEVFKFEILRTEDITSIEDQEKSISENQNTENYLWEFFFL